MRIKHHSGCGSFSFTTNYRQRVDTIYFFPTLVGALFLFSFLVVSTFFIIESSCKNKANTKN